MPASFIPSEPAKLASSVIGPDSSRPSINHLPRLLGPRQFRHAAEVEDRQHLGFAPQHQPIEHRRRELCQPDHVADIAFRDTFLSGEIDDGGDVTALQPVPRS
jgi:hypothetical protein